MRTSRRFGRAAAAVLSTVLFAPLLTGVPAHAASRDKKTPVLPPQETGFLNRSIQLQGVTYKFQVYLPEDYRRPETEKEPKKGQTKEADRAWPVILFLHGRGERGSEGMWQTQIGLPQQLRDHPERWPFIVVIPQCPWRHFWTDPEMLQLAMSSLDQEQREFHTDPDRIYLAGLSLGGYGAAGSY